MFSYRNDRLETKAKEPMGPNRNKSRATWQTWQFLATGPLSLSIQQCGAGACATAAASADAADVASVASAVAAAFYQIYTSWRPVVQEGDTQIYTSCRLVVQEGDTHIYTSCRL